MTDSIFSFDSQATYTFPIPTGYINVPILQVADPVMNGLCSFFSQLLNTNLMPRFSQEAVASGLTHSTLDNWVDGYAVAQTICFPLNEQNLKANDFKFPLLAIQPDTEEFISWTMTSLSTKRNFKVSYILPPMTAPQYNRMYSFLGVAAKTILAYGTQGYDPKISNISIWQQIGISFGFMKGASYLYYPGVNLGKDKSFFPTVEFSISIIERNQNPVAVNYSGFTGGFETKANVIDAYSPANPIISFIDGYVQPNISLTSLSNNTGTIQGGTMLVLSGNGFYQQKIKSISICGSNVASFNVKTPFGILMYTAPGITGNTTVGNVVLTDVYGNQYTLADAFTYTTP